MATTKFDPYRTTGGTIELVRDSKTGAYSTKTVGFAKLPVLNLPELGTTTGAATTTAATTKTATDLTGTGLTKQTSEAFKIPESQNDNDRSLDLDLTRQGRDISKSLSDIDSGRGGDSASAISRQTANLDNVSTPTTIQDSMLRSNRFDADTFDDKTGLGIQKATGDIATQGVSRFSGDEDTTGVTVKDTSVIDKSPTFLKNLFGEPRGVEVARGRQPVEGVRSTETVDQLSKAEQEAFDRKQMVAGATPDDATANRLGISAEPSATRLAKEADFASGTLDTRVPDAIKEGQPAVAARKTFSESVKTALKGFKTPAMAVLESVGDALTNPQQRSLNNSNAAALGSLGYRTRGQLGSSTDPGRIAGNPADNVFAGMNLKSARGNVMTASKARIDKIKASAAKTTDKAKAARMKAKAAKFERQRQEALDRKEKQQAAKNKKDLATGGVAPGASGGDRGGNRKIVCTMMNESYGFGSFRNKIWLRQSKNLAPEYQTGYHKLFLPLVKYAKQKGITNSIVKKTLEHIAIHRTIDIRQEEKNKIHLIGRVYRKILEPICYWAGKV